MLSLHTRKGLGQRARSGLFHGEPPFGYERCTEECYRINDDHPGCHLVPEKAALVQQLFEKYVGGGESLRSLARWMNEQGVRTNNRRAIVAGDGAAVEGPQPFTGYSIRWILRNRFYLGNVRHHDEEYDGLQQPLVSDSLFRQAQQRLIANRSHSVMPGASNNEYLLKGLAHCVYCGFAMWADTRGRNKTAYYRDRAGLSASNCEQGGGKSVRAEILEAQVKRIFSRLRLRSDWKEWVIAQLTSETERGEALRVRRLLEEKAARLRELYVDGDIPREEYQLRKRDIDSRLSTLVVPEVDASVVAGEMLENTGEIWNEATVAERHQMLSSMVEAVYIDPQSRKVVGLLPTPPFRNLFLCLDQSDGVEIYDPEEVNSGPTVPTSQHHPEVVDYVVRWRRGRVELPVQSARYASRQPAALGYVGQSLHPDFYTQNLDPGGQEG